MSAVAWLLGWHRNLDGWFVHARRAHYPDLSSRPDVGFTEESAIAVRTPDQALRISLGWPL